MYRLIALLCLFGLPAFANEAALVIANTRYDTLPRTAQDLRGFGRATDALEEAEVRVVSARNASRQTIFARIRAFSQLGRTADASAIVLTGRFGVIGGSLWFLPTDAEGDGPLEIAESGVPIAAMADLMADPMDGLDGPRLLVLGAADPEAIPMMDLPDGLTLVVTDPVRALRFTRDTLAAPGARIAQQDGLRVSGFAPQSLTFLPRGSDDGTAEESYWVLTQQRDNADAYRAYLSRYPDGSFALEARLRLDELTETPEQRAERAESALGLTRQQRRDIQRDLSLLGYNTRGIDGIFGRGTRGALRSWQTRNDFPQNGYLTSRQVQLLDAQGARRAAELEAEERRRAEELRLQDERLWSSMGDRRSEADLIAYLDQFPDGIYADRARTRLNRIRDRRAEETGAAERERQLWRATRDQNTVQGYQTYINAFPNGAFVREARAAIARMQALDTRDTQAEAAEAAVGLNAITRRAIETRLAQLDLNPGAVDGTFDANTRAALRRYQQRAGLPVTGYVNQITAVRLLADTLRDVLR